MASTRPGLSADGRKRLERELALLREQRRELAADLSDDDPVGDRADQAVASEQADDLAQMDGRIASEDEGARVFTLDSPLGLALADRHVGDAVTYPTPDGEASVDVLAIVPPSR